MSAGMLCTIRRSFRLVVHLFALVLLVAAAAEAQVAAGLIQGTLVDEQGGALPGVTLTLRNVETGVTRTSVTESDGRYRFPALQPGRYDLMAELPGFAS